MNRVMIAIGIVMAIILVVFIVKAEKHSDACKQRGGTVIDTPSGRLCAKIERI